MDPAQLPRAARPTDHHRGAIGLGVGTPAYRQPEAAAAAPLVECDRPAGLQPAGDPQDGSVDVGGLGAVLAGTPATAVGTQPALWVLTTAYAATGLVLLLGPLRGRRDLPAREAATP